MIRKKPRVVSDSIDEAGVAATLKVEPQHIEPAMRGHAGLVVDLSATVEHGNAEPRIGAAITCGPDDGADSLGAQVQLLGRLIRQWPGRDKGLRRLRGGAATRDELIDARADLAILMSAAASVAMRSSAR